MSIRPLPLPSTSSTIHHSSVILPFGAVQYDVTDNLKLYYSQCWNISMSRGTHVAEHDFGVAVVTWHIYR